MDRAVIFDIDNTVIDTAVRKQKLLQEFGIEDVAIDEIRNDFWLHRFLGDEKSNLARRYFQQLEAAKTISEHAAPLLAGARETILWLQKQGIVVHYMSSRPESLRAATLAELHSHRLPVDAGRLHLCSGGGGRVSSRNALAGMAKKTEAIRKLLANYIVLAAVGDRPEDMRAAANAGIAAILITSTTRSSELGSSLDGTVSSVCESWPEVAVALAKLVMGDSELKEQRKIFIDNYVRWLGEIDSKSQTTILISGALSALTTPVLTGEHFSFRTDWLLVIVLLLSITSMIYSVRSFTSRYTSGALTARAVPVLFRQWIAILIDHPERWKSVDGDALRKYRSLKDENAVAQASAHLVFFNDRYGTSDPDALLNLRLYEMRAANYSKLYPERLASKLLVVAMVLSSIWIVTKVEIVSHILHAMETLATFKP